MDSESFERYLSDRYKKEIAWYDEKANCNRTLYHAFQWTLIILSAVTPILVVVGGQWQRWTAVVVSALVAIGTSALKTFQYHELWINYRTTCETLRKEIHYYQSRTSPYTNTADPEGLFVDRVEALISRENTLWLSTTKQEEKQGGAHK